MGVQGWTRSSCAPPPPPACAGLRRLRRYARSFPMAQPRTLACLGWSYWLRGRRGAAHRAWTRAIGEAERLAMPWELANAHHELGRHLAAGERSPLGLDRTEHLDRARSSFEALGCRTDPLAPAGDRRPADLNIGQGRTGRWHGISAQPPRPQ